MKNNTILSGAAGKNTQPLKEPDHRTPRPWKLEWEVDEYGGRGTWTIIRNENDYGPYIHVRCEQDGRMIVRAVNAHDELVSRIQAAVGRIESVRDAIVPGGIVDQAVQILKEALRIAKAEDR